MPALEQTHAEAVLQDFHLMPDGTRCDLELACSELEAQMARRGFESAQRIQWWQAIGHAQPLWLQCRASLHQIFCGKLVCDFVIGERPPHKHMVGAGRAD